MSADLLAAFSQTGQVQNPVSEDFRERSTTASTRAPGESTFNRRDSSHSTLRQSHAQPGLTRIEPIFQPSNVGGNDVLFDATEERDERDDDFGDFEVVETFKTSSPKPIAPDRIIHGVCPPVNHRGSVSEGNKEEPLLDLLSLDDTPAQVSTQPQIHTEETISALEFFETTSSALQTMPDTTPAPMQGQADDDDVWGDFEAVPAQPAAPSPSFSHSRTHAPSHPSVMQPKPTATPLPPAPPPEEADDWDTFEDQPPMSKPPSLSPAPAPSKPTSISTSSIPNNAERPTTIPPPSILLSLLPTTFSYLLTLALSTSKPSPPSADHPTPAIPTEDLPNLIQSTYRASARITSTPARALRWRRDTLLSQSTRIGVAGKSGGMKLSPLNKSESVKEEREAAEAVESWNSKIHQFSKVLQNSGVKLKGGLKLSIHAPVKPLTGAGAIQATVVCPVCGLKRSERLVGVDEGVEDVFGEYWLEIWGHRDCAEWWYRWSSELGQR